MTTTAEHEAFPVTWDDPADAGRCWRFSAEHMPNAMSPLEFELGLQGFLEGFGWGMVPRQFNYYIYFANEPVAGPPQTPPTARTVRAAALRWQDEVLPEVLEHIEYYRVTDFASMADGQLVAEIERLREVRFRSGQLHTLAIQPHWQGMSLLIATYKELAGGDDLAALRLIQGYPDKSFESGERLWRVGRSAAGLPLVAGRLLAMERATALETLAALRADPAAAPFVEEFDAYLDTYGWRSNASFGTPTWAEDPTVPLMLVRAYLESDDYDPAVQQRRLVEERDAAVRETMAALDGEGRARLADVLDAAVAVSPQLEDHNFFIDQRLACMPRRLVLAAARRLVAKGALDEPGRVFFLRVPELLDALQGAATSGATQSLRETAWRRKEELAYWRTVAPPPYLGAPPPEGMAPEASPAAQRDGSGELRGNGVSAGVARGPARIIRSLAEADRLRPGDVLVTSVTHPSWTPLFGVAGAIVTEVGGMLSHTAVAAREFRLPAVVAVPNATRRLRNGQLVEVDGSAGTVRLIG